MADALTKFHNILTKTGMNDIDLTKLTDPNQLKNTLSGLTPDKLITIAKTIKSEFNPSQNQKPLESEIPIAKATIQKYEALKKEYEDKSTAANATAIPIATAVDIPNKPPSQIDNMKGQLISGIKDFYSEIKNSGASVYSEAKESGTQIVSEIKNSEIAGHVTHAVGNVAQLSDKALGIVDRIDRTTMAFTGLFEVIGNTYKTAIEVQNFGKEALIETGKFGLDATLQAGKLGVGAALAAGQNASNIGQELLKTVGSHTNIIVDGLLSLISLPISTSKLLLTPSVSGSTNIESTKQSLKTQSDAVFSSYAKLSKVFLHSYAAILGCDPDKWFVNFFKKTCNENKKLDFNRFESKVQGYTAEIDIKKSGIQGEINRLNDVNLANNIVERLNDSEKYVKTQAEEIQKIIETKATTPVEKSGGMKRHRTPKLHQKGIRKTRQHKRKTRRRRRKNTLRR